MDTVEKIKALRKQGCSDLEILGEMDFISAGIGTETSTQPEPEGLSRELLVECYYRFWAEGETPEFIAEHYNLPLSTVLTVLEKRNWHDEVDTRIWDYLREGQPAGDGTVLSADNYEEDTEANPRVHTIHEI